MPLIDPDKIYPKRIGIHRGAIVLEYYNLEADKFKKHLIPLERSSTSQKNVQQILKNPKHSAFLRRVAPENLKKVISKYLGEKYTDVLPPNINENSSSFKPSNFKKSQSSNYNNSSISGQRQSEQSYQQNESKNSFGQNSLSFSIAHQGKDIKNQIQESYGYSMNFDEELSVSIAKKKEENKKPSRMSEEIEEDFDNYDEDFEQFEGEEEKQLLKQDEKEQELRLLDLKRKKQQQQQKRKKQQEERTRKQLEASGFDFLDQQDKPKKKKKKKNKSKEKKHKKQQVSLSNTSSQLKDDTPIQQQFDFI